MTNTRPAYQTDVNDKAWEIIQKLLPQKESFMGRPRKYALREILNGMFYVIGGGVEWRLMPHDLAPWSLVYNYYWHWKQQGLFEKINAKLVELSRERQGREEHPSLGILDTQSVKTAWGGEARGIDGNKKINGRKRHVVTDVLGHLLAVKVTAANVSDQAGGKAVARLWQGCGKAVLTTLHDRQHAHAWRLTKILADGGYLGLVAVVLTLFGWVLEMTRKPEGAKGFVLQPKRGVLERFHAWQGRYRRLSKDYERTTPSSEAMSYLASIHRLASRIF